MLVIVPPQVYLERLYRGQFAGSFLDWLPQAFSGGAYPDGNLSWHHLWFLAYVLVLTLGAAAGLPVGAHRRRGATRSSGPAGSAARFGLQWLMVLPLAASILWLAPISHNINGLVGDWHGLVSYGALLLYGAFIFGSTDLLTALRAPALLSLAIGIAAYAALYVVLLRRARCGP